MERQERTDNSFENYQEALLKARKAVESLSLKEDGKGDNGEYATKCIKQARNRALCCDFNQHDLEKSSRELDLLQKQLTEKLTQGKAKKTFSFSRRKVQGEKVIQKTDECAVLANESQSISQKQSNFVVAEDSETKVVDGITNDVVVVTSEKGRFLNLTLKNLNNALVVVLDQFITLKMFDIKDCVLFCAPVVRSVLCYRAEKSRFQIAAQQIRLHDMNLCQLSILCSGGTIIESCRNLLFGKYAFFYPDQKKHLADARLSFESSAWKEIQDFDLINPLQKSENWKFMEIDDVVQLPDDFSVLSDSDKKERIKELANFAL